MQFTFNNSIYLNKRKKPSTNLLISRGFHWWRRGESNPCPKTATPEHLRVQLVF